LGIDGNVDELEATPAQAPIGTRPRSAHVPNTQLNNTPKLNPAAPSFKTIFTRSSTDKKPEKSNKSKKNKAAAKQKQEEERQSLESEDHLSTSRVSRDAMSISTVDYSTDDAATCESLDVPGGSSATPSETGGSASQHGHQTKESFMQKLSRKSSAGFTTLAGRKGKKGAGRDDLTIDSTGPEDELSRSVTSVTVSAEDKGAPSPSLSAAARGFKFRSLRRKKADRQADAESEEPMDAEAGGDEGRREKEKDK
jgi:hypothetical protein